MADFVQERTIDYSYEIVPAEDGELFLLRSDGVGLSISVFDGMLELSRQNPSFFDHWIGLMETYLFLVPPPEEA